MDVFDIRDKIERFEKLEDMEPRDEDEEIEYLSLAEFLEDVKNRGGDHQWRGDWYPVTFIADYDFVEYARELAEELGMVTPNAQWPYTCVDWERAADELRQDYSSTEFDGKTYLYC